MSNRPLPNTVLCSLRPGSYKDSFIGGNIAETLRNADAEIRCDENHVLGLEVVTATGEVIRRRKTVKNVVGFD